MKTSEILNKAADLIEQRGWTQGCSGWDDDGDGTPLCLEGGIQAALGSGMELLANLRACPAYIAVSDYLGRDLESDLKFFTGVFAWNDALHRTAEEVIEVLRATAVIEAARESAPVKVEVSA